MKRINFEKLILPTTAILVMTVIIIVYMIYGDEINKSDNMQNDSSNTPIKVNSTPTTPIIKGSDGNKPDPGIMLYIQDGDIWRSNTMGSGAMKLVDRDSVIDAKFSPDKKYLAYSQLVPTVETVPSMEGNNETIELSNEHDAKRQLFIADSYGVNSKLVADRVYDWGWIPDTELIWYESTTLKEEFWWGYFRDNRIWLFDINDNNHELINNENNGDYLFNSRMLKPQWSPDGYLLAYYGYRRDQDGHYFGTVLKVLSRQTHEVKNLLDIPWIGGDRGGPPPLPITRWSPNSNSIFVAMTPIVNDDQKISENYINLYKSGYLSLLEVPVDGSVPVLMIEPTPSVYVNDEDNGKLLVSDDNLNVVFVQYDNSITETTKPFEWMGQYEEIGTEEQFIHAHLDEKSLKNIGSEVFNNYMRYSRCFDDCGFLLEDKAMYFLLMESEGLMYLQGITISLIDGSIRILFTLPGPDNNESVEDTHYNNESQTLYFRLADKLYVYKNSTLYQLHDGISNVEYYF